MANIQFPFIVNSTIWDISIRTLIYIQFAIIQVLALYEITRVIFKKNSQFFLFFSIMCVVNLVFSFNPFVPFATVFWKSVGSDGEYIGNLIKSFVIILLAALIGWKYWFKNKPFVFFFGLFIIISIFPLIFTMLIDKKYIEIMLILLLVITFDSSAYFGGKIYGKRRPFIGVSPTKTIAGYVIGMTTAAFIFISVYGLIALLSRFHLTQILNNKISLYSLFIIAIFLVIGSAGGDLLFSKIKREFGIKDFSKLIPGHGGILDRADGIFTTLFLFALIAPFY